MSILWDAPLTATVARELREKLTGSHLRAVRMDRHSRDLVLHFRKSTLVFRLHPLHGDVALLDAREPGRGSIALKAQLREIRTPPDERLLMLQLQPPAAGASPEGLVVELMTNQWNAIWLTVGNERIRRVLWRRALEDRTLAAGEIYRPPSPSDRRGIDEPLTEREWLELLEPVEPKKRRGALLRCVAFTSSVNAAPLLGRRGTGSSNPSPPKERGSGGGGSEVGDSGGGGSEVDGSEEGGLGEAASGVGASKVGASSDTKSLLEGYRSWLRIRAVSLGLEPAEPCILETKKRREPYPLPLPAAEYEPAPSLLEAFEGAVAEDPDRSSPRTALLPSSLLERLDRARTRARTKAQRLREELAETPEPDRIRGLGDLILARYSEIPRGSEKATLEGFERERVEVELDPALSVAENADRYYREAARIERARERLPRLIDEAEKRVRELREIRDQARCGNVSPETVEGELPEESPARPDYGRRRSREQAPKVPYRKYRSSGGLEIRVGRGAKANDELTFHHSSPDDVWLHARQVAGAHVILRWQDEGNPPARDLAQAASLAALHSDARHATSVPVDWTRRKYVRSPRKSPPGIVVPDRVKTVFVDPDPELEKRLREG